MDNYRHGAIRLVFVVVFLVAKCQGGIVTISVLGVGRLHLDGVVHLQGRDRDIWRTQTTEDMARDIVYTPHRILSKYSVFTNVDGDAVCVFCI